MEAGDHSKHEGRLEVFGLHSSRRHSTVVMPAVALATPDEHVKRDDALPEPEAADLQGKRSQAPNAADRDLSPRDSKGIVNTSDGGRRHGLHFNGCLTRTAMPLLKLVDRPWKMYPVGLLFGLGFDTASSIALLGVAAVAARGPGGSEAASVSNSSQIILLPLLFTAGMSLVDSLDSVLMIYAYAPPATCAGRPRWALFENDAGRRIQDPSTHSPESHEKDETGRSERNDTDGLDNAGAAAAIAGPASRFSLLLTLLSILMAFAISIIEFMGLAADRCARCGRAADKQEAYETRFEIDSAQVPTQGGGLEGRWWLFWRRANDKSGYVGAGERSRRGLYLLRSK